MKKSVIDHLEDTVKKNKLKEPQITVAKRNGMIVPFRHERIHHAIESAFRDTKQMIAGTPLDTETEKTILQITNLVVQQVLSLASKGFCLTVESIQDAVEFTLMKNGYQDVARDYIVYRNNRKEKRETSLQNLKIYRRDKTTPVRFNPMKIASSIEEAFRRARSVHDQISDETVAIVNRMTKKIVEEMVELASTGDILYIDMTEDRIERELMSEKVFDVAKAYILYRAEKTKRNAPTQSAIENSTARRFQIYSADHSPISITDHMVHAKIAYACRGYEQVSAESLLENAIAQFHEGMNENDVDQAIIFAAKSKIETEPAYSKVAARLLLDLIYRETLSLSATDSKLTEQHRTQFKKYLQNAINLQLLSPALLDFDLDLLSTAIDVSRDDLFPFLGLEILNNRFFLRHENHRFETPQFFWMRIAMGLALNEGDRKNERAIEFYHLLSQLYFTPSTATLLHAGTPYPQLSSCYLSIVKDDLNHIFKTISDNATLSKWTGEIGNDWTSMRAKGSLIQSTRELSNGIIPFLKIANDTAIAVNQSEKKQGDLRAYLEIWHLDLEDFLELKRANGDERRRTHDIHTANWIPDLFMKRVRDNGQWTLFNPSEVSDLHDLYGAAFEKRYAEYEKMALDGKIKLFKHLEALQLWHKMLSVLFETGDPCLTFKDASNIRSSQDHQGIIHSANLYTEILLNTSEKEIASCNLGSINLLKHVTDKGIDEKLIASTVRTAVRMLDNEIDINFYPIDEVKNTNLLHRPIGLGIMGFQDAITLQNISYASHAAVEFADKSMEMISYYAILASTELAKERGAYSSYPGSKWDRGLLPIDTIDLLENDRGVKIELDRSGCMEWTPIRTALKKHGLRNSNLMAIAPTTTIASIAGVTPSIEPIYKHLYVKSTHSGDLTLTNPFLVEKLKSLKLWNSEMLDDLLYFDGSIREINSIPQDVKDLFLTAFEIGPEWLIECAAHRQKWIDMGQTLNLYLTEPSGKKLHQMYMHAWEKGLKTTNYLFSQSSIQIEPSNNVEPEKPLIN